MTYYDRFTGKQIDRPSNRLLKPNGQRCEHCGTECIDGCPFCGAPQCCPKCCMESSQNGKGDA